MNDVVMLGVPTALGGQLPGMVPSFASVAEHFRG